MIKNIIFDFDGVILDSMPIRDFGFREILKEYPKELVEKFIEFHQINAGLSRFYKIKYFYNEMLKEEISEEKIQEYANKFSQIMKKELTNKKYLIMDSVSFIENNYLKYNMHVASGSEEKELQYLCKELGLEKYFKSIHGSPVHKNELVKMIIDENNYDITETIMIGDSINDYDAAKINGIDFYGYNNEELKNKEYYIKEFNDL